MSVVRDGFDITGTTTQRNMASNAPVGHRYYDTTLSKLFVMGPAGWEHAGSEEEQSSSSSSSSISTSSVSSVSSSSSSSISSSSASSSSSSQSA